ncbi:MAG: O-antigen ligase family protein [Acidobacteriota bacterium]
MTGDVADRGFERVRALLFLATGLAVPLYAFPPVRLAGKPVDLATIFAAVFVAASLLSLLPARGRMLAPAVAVLAAAVPLAVLLPPRPSSFATGRFLSSAAHWALLIAFFAAAAAWRPSAVWRRRIVLANLAAGAAVALFALYQLVGNPRGWPGTGPVIASWQREPFRFTPIGGFKRPTSLFLEPAWMGGYLAGTLALALLWPSESRRESALRWAAAILGVAAIAASVSWGAYVDAAVVLAAASLYRTSRRSSSRRAAGVAAAAVALAAALALTTPPARRVLAAVGERLALLRNTTANEASGAADTPRVRLRNASHAWRLFAEHPWRGVGFGQFGRYAWDVPKGPERAFEESLSRRDPWCGWLTIAAEAGFAGPLVLAAAVAIAARRARGAAAGVVAALAALAVVQQIHTGSYIDLWWWYPLGLAAALGASADARSGALASGPA